jgi:NADH-quinone oxidoreductase subunit M
MGLLGLFTMTLEGITGSFLFMIGHGFVAGALFFLIGILFTRYNTRSILYFGGFLKYMPVFSFFFFILILANIAFPFTISFVSEFLVLVSISVKSKLLFLILIPTTILNLVNSLFLYIRICHGIFPSQILSKFLDLLTIDFLCCLLLSLLILIFGIAPNIILDFVNAEFMVFFVD